MISISLPLRLVSTPNMREHWSKRAKRTKEHRSLTAMAVRRHAWVGLPIHVCITRIGPRIIDMDNAIASAKAVRDGIADAFQVDDGDTAKITFEYAQQKGLPKQFGVLIQIESREMKGTGT